MKRLQLPKSHSVVAEAERASIALYQAKKEAEQKSKAGSWWLHLSREQLQQRAQQEASRMALSKFAKLESPSA